MTSQMLQLPTEAIRGKKTREEDTPGKLEEKKVTLLYPFSQDS